jgi:hypothetical protein
MKRHHLIELHEQPWYPASTRRHFQDALGTVVTRLNLYGPASKRVAEILQEVGATEVMDLCSGSSDPLVHLCKQVAKHNPDLAGLSVYLTDLFPNVPRFSEHQKRHPEIVRFSAEPIDATNTPARPDLPRVRTILSALHHFQPDQVRAIFKDAAKHADAIVVLDVPPRTRRSLLMNVAQWPWIFKTCFTRRASWRFPAVLSTIVVPIVPMTLCLDGLVSMLRGYHPQELLDLAREANDQDFSWEAGVLPGPMGALYLYGRRRNLKSQSVKRHRAV